ncbi:MAG: hypothetical protein ACFFDT_37040 [Candidatus Hodarchaeota archaeon]
MSEYHILEQASDKESFQVVFHIAIPTTAKNEANILYTDIVKNSEDLNSVIPGFQANFPTEYQDMQDGKVIERVINVKLSSLILTPAQKLDEIINGNYLWEGYDSYKTNLLSELQIRWEWYGKNGDTV